MSKDKKSNFFYGFTQPTAWVPCFSFLGEEEGGGEEGRERWGSFFFWDSLVLEAVLIYGKHFILGFTFFSLQGHPHFGVHILFGSCLEF